MQHPTQNLRQQQLNFATRQDNENKTKSFRRTTGEISLVQRAQHIFAVTSKILVASASARDDFVDFRYLCQMLMTHEVDIFGLPAESGLDWKQHTPRNKCKQITCTDSGNIQDLSPQQATSNATRSHNLEARAQASQANGRAGF